MATSLSPSAPRPAPTSKTIESIQIKERKKKLQNEENTKIKKHGGNKYNLANF